MSELLLELFQIIFVKKIANKRIKEYNKDIIL